VVCEVKKSGGRTVRIIISARVAGRRTAACMGAYVLMLASAALAVTLLLLRDSCLGAGNVGSHLSRIFWAVDRRWHRAHHES